MVSFQNSILINRPLDEVFALLSNAENETRWRSGEVAVKQTSNGPIGIDSTWTSVAQILGQRIENQMAFTEYEANWKYTVRSQSGPYPYENQVTFERVADFTMVCMRAEVEAGPFFKMGEPLLTSIVKRQTQDDLANLKNMMEANAFSAPGRGPSPSGR